MQSIGDVLFEEEDIMVACSSNAEDARFDQIIGHIEDIIMEPEFQSLQDDFMENNYKHFMDSDENKFIYSELHKEYVNKIEKYLEEELKRRIENFSMQDFMKDLMSRKQELDGEIFEILITFVDFLEFKALMLSYKAEKEGRSFSFGCDMVIQSINFEQSKALNESSNAMSVDLGLALCGKSITLAKPEPVVTASTESHSAANRTKESKTPLLDKIEIDSDTDITEPTDINTIQNQETMPQ